MLRSGATAQRLRRTSAPLALRSLAALVALLLVSSWLGQAAHFLLVQHRVCAEHGELVEVHAGGYVPEHANGHESPEQTRATTPELEGEHDHCQLLARSQRDLALPAAPAAATVPTCEGALLSPVSAHSVASGAAPLLSLAPKTSPPQHAALG